jgi:hypothetical protein
LDRSALNSAKQRIAHFVKHVGKVLNASHIPFADRIIVWCGISNLVTSFWLNVFVDRFDQLRFGMLHADGKRMDVLEQFARNFLDVYKIDGFAGGLVSSLKGVHEFEARRHDRDSSRRAIESTPTSVKRLACACRTDCKRCCSAFAHSLIRNDL